MIFYILSILKLLETELAAVVSGGGAEFEGRTNLTRKSRNFLVGNRRLIMSREEEQDLKVIKY